MDDLVQLVVDAMGFAAKCCAAIAVLAIVVGCALVYWLVVS